MKWLLIVVLVCSVLASGCAGPVYVCPTCEEEVSSISTPSCVHCGQEFDLRFGISPRHPDPEIENQMQQARDEAVETTAAYDAAIETNSTD